MYIKVYRYVACILRRFIVNLVSEILNLNVVFMINVYNIYGSSSTFAGLGMYIYAYLRTMIFDKYGTVVGI